MEAIGEGAGDWQKMPGTALGFMQADFDLGIRYLKKKKRKLERAEKDALPH